VELLVSGKTNTWDDSIILDTELWLHPFLETLAARLTPEEPLWCLSGTRLIAMFKDSVDSLGMSHLAPVRYSLRHGGASDDAISKRRSLLEIKKRGQWRTDQSLKRYAKESKVSEELQKIPLAVLEYGRHIEANLEMAFHLAINLTPPCNIVPVAKRLRRK